MSAVNVLATTEELTKAVQAATSPEAIKAALLDEVTRQNSATETAAAEQAAKDAAAKTAADAATAAAAATATAAPASFSRTETIGGREFNFEAPTELELERMITNAFKVASVVQEPAATVDPAAQVAEQAAAAAAVAAQAEARTELELKFKRGEISASEYIEKSGAVKEYLEKQGVPLDELKATVEAGRTAKYEQSWQSATEEFLKSPGGQDWPGGQKNLNIIGLKLAALGLTEAKDKVAAFTTAWNSMKAEGVYFPVEAVSVEKTEAQKTAETAAAANAAATAAATATASAQAATTAAATAAAAKTASTSSSLFGRSAGVQTENGTTTPAAQKAEIPKDATPEEILAAWKASVAASGQNVDEAFKQTFSAKR